MCIFFLLLNASSEQLCMQRWRCSFDSNNEKKKPCVFIHCPKIANFKIAIVCLFCSVQFGSVHILPLFYLSSACQIFSTVHLTLYTRISSSSKALAHALDQEQSYFVYVYYINKKLKTSHMEYHK